MADVTQDDRIVDPLERVVVATRDDRLEREAVELLEHRVVRARRRPTSRFVGVDAIWDAVTVTREDVRESYGEVRLVTFGVLEGVVVVLVHTDRDEEMHVISLRKAEPYEARYYLEAVEEYFQKGRGP
mgnify:CR=1 FL=1